MSKSKKAKQSLMLFLILGATGYGSYHYINAREPSGHRFQTATVDRGDIAETVTATGTLHPVVTVQVGSQVSGRIQELFADFNSTVTEDQVIAKIDSQLFQSDVTRARANLMVAQSSVARAQAELDDARLRHSRAAALAEKKLVAQADADSARASFQAAQSGLASSRAGLVQAQAALEHAETNLAYTTIRSPINGIVISRDVDVGQTVAASLQAPTLFTIAEDLRIMEIHTNVAESDVGRIEAPMAVRFSVDAHPLESFKGEVKQVRFAPETQQNVVTYNAVVSVNNDHLKLRPGMTADVTFIVEDKNGALRIPNSALRFRPPPELIPEMGPESEAQVRGPAGSGGGNEAKAGQSGSKGTREARNPEERAARQASRRVVWIQKASGDIQAVPIRVGITDGRFTEILGAGLSAGDQVLVGLILPGMESSSNTNRPPAGGGGGGGRRPGGFL